MERINVTPEQLQKAADLVAKYPDLDVLEARLEAASRALAPIELRTPKDVFTALDKGVITPKIAARLFALPAPPRSFWRRVWEGE